MKRALALLVIATPLFAGSQVTATHAAIATSSRIATQAGLNVLKRGGNAIDAAIASAFVLGVVQPQAAGMGGGGFLVYFDAKSGAIWTLDFREVSPVEAKSDAKLHAATPGFLAGLDAMHTKFGTQGWRELIAPAIALAREQTKNELAATMTRIADTGVKNFYSGAIAERFIDAVKSGGGAIGHRDLRDYTPMWRAPIRIRFGDYDIFAPAPPSSGGLVIGETLNIIGAYDLTATGFQSVKTLHLLTEAQRRASIDERKAVGDPANARIPYRDLLSPDHANTWRASIKSDKVTSTIMLTDSVGQTRMSGPHATIAIIDAAGNVAAMTTTNGGEFIVPGFGFVLNDAMTEFSTSGINEFASSKRPATPVSPAIVLKNGRPYIALASAGLTTALQVIVNSIVFKKALYDSVAAARYHQESDPDQIEYEKSLAPKATIDALNAMGHGVLARESIGDVQALQFERGKIFAVADPRHGGAAGGY